MAAILFNGAEPFEQVMNYSFDRRPHVKSGKIAQAVSEKKALKNSMILYMYITQGQGQINTREQNFDFN